MNSQSPRRRKLLRWTGGLLLVYALIGFLIAPVLVRLVAVKQMSALLGREVSIEKVRLNPFALSGSIRGFLIRDLDGKPYVSWDEAYANFQLSSFFGHPWVFMEVTTTNPFVRVQINTDYSLNFSDILARFGTNTAPASTAPSKPLALCVDTPLRSNPANFRFSRPRVPSACRITWVRMEKWNCHGCSWLGMTRPPQTDSTACSYA